MKEKYSEDYEHLLKYHLNPTKETAAEQADFFAQKYKPLINHFCKLFLKFGKTASLTHSYTDKIDFEERTGFLRDYNFLQFEKKHFNYGIHRYIVRAVENFNPEIITTKENYSFSSYLKLWLKTGLRDLRSLYKKYRIREIPCINHYENEESLIEKIDTEIIYKKLAKVLSTLSPLDVDICKDLSAGKKQNEIQIKNKETGNFYSTGYICKRIQAIRKIMEENGLESF